MRAVGFDLVEQPAIHPLTRSSRRRCTAGRDSLSDRYLIGGILPAFTLTVVPW